MKDMGRDVIVREVEILEIGTVELVDCGRTRGGGWWAVKDHYDSSKLTINN